jgi:hypothetical protein
MNTRSRTILATTVLAGFLLAGLFMLEGCKKKEAPAQPAEANKPAAVVKAKETAVAAIEQTTCPVLAAPIDKNVFTEYKGKKVARRFISAALTARRHSSWTRKNTSRSCRSLQSRDEIQAEKVRK